MVEVVIRAVRVDVGSATPLLLLEEVNGPRVLAVYIGAQEATAIAYALQGVEAPRPMTHDLLGDVIEALGAQIFAVEVTELVDNTYFAALRLVSNGSDITVSSRPSDAIALALRAGAPILVNDDVMAEYSKEMDLGDANDAIEIVIEAQLNDGDDEGEASESALVDELRAFLDTVKPEDFGE
jgi:bifunctional DNase/RNase